MLFWRDVVILLSKTGLDAEIKIEEEKTTFAGTDDDLRNIDPDTVLHFYFYETATAAISNIF